MEVEDINKFLKKFGVIVFQKDSFIIFLKEGFWGVLYVKPSRRAPFKMAEKKKMEKMDAWSFARVVYGGKNSNWPKIKKELEEWLK